VDRTRRVGVVARPFRATEAAGLKHCATDVKGALGAYDDRRHAERDEPDL
jgi:hypothetical protein